jgi:hypothetical protein
MKTKRFFLFGLPVVLLALGLVLAGCGDDDDDDGGNGGGGGGGDAAATISGTPRMGATLTVTYTGFTPSFSGTYWKYAHSLTGTEEGNVEFNSTYTIASPVQEGDYIWVEASNSDHSVEVVSERVGPVTAAE